MVFCMGRNCKELTPPLWCSTLKRFAMIRFNKLEDYAKEDNSKIVAWFKRGSTLDFYILNEVTTTDWYDTFLSFGLPSLSRGIETLNLLVQSDKNLVGSKREGALCNLKTLIIEVIEAMVNVQFIDIVDNALRRCPHIKALHIVSASDPNWRKSFQFEYKPSSAEDHESCYRTGVDKKILKKVSHSKLTEIEECVVAHVLLFKQSNPEMEEHEFGTVVHRRDEFYWEQVKLYAKREELGD